MSTQLYCDSRSMELTEYVMAERCVQVELAKILDEGSFDIYSTLTYILAGGFKGFHNMQFDQLVREYKGIEKYWYRLYDNWQSGEGTVSLKWKPYDEDPVNFLPEV